MVLKNIDNKKAVWSWALYDWANSVFATTVMAGFFPVFFKKYWSLGSDVSLSTFKLGMANTCAGLLLAIVAPLLGSIADVGYHKKHFLALFMAVGALATAGLYFVGQGEWQLAVLFYVLASFGFAASNIFYDSLLVTVSRGRFMDYISSLGYALGYLGGALLFTVNVLMYLHPQWFGLNSGAAAIKISFLMVALWWMVFSFPLFKTVKENQKSSQWWSQSKMALARLKNTFVHVHQLKTVFLFLLAYLCYIDGVNTIIKMAVDFGLSIGFQASDLILALLITNFIGFPAAIAFGYLGEKWGAKKGIYLGLAVYVVVTVWGSLMHSVIEFYALATLIGLVQGGIQALSRSYYARLIPAEQAGEFFGFFNMLGKFSAVIGPGLVGFISLETHAPRASLLVILVFFAIGAALLWCHDRTCNNESSKR